MPKKRSPKNKGFPPGWRWKNGAIRYRVPEGCEDLWDGKKEYTLGKTPSEAHRTWAQKVEIKEVRRTIAQLLDRYLAEVIPTKAKKTQRDQIMQTGKLRAVFGEMPLGDMTPQEVYKYIDMREAKVAARREIALLSHAYTKAVEWGDIKLHPFKGEIRIEGATPRKRYVEDWEIEEALAMPPVREKDATEMIRAYIELKLITGLRQKDMLLLREDMLKEDGIHVTPSKTEKKTGKSLIILWTPALRRAVERARAARPVDISPLLFCTRRGEPYHNEETGMAEAFSSIWQRWMARVLKETKITERFTEHDIRGKTGSDSESDEEARKRLGHSDVKITRASYRRKAEVVTPLK